MKRVPYLCVCMECVWASVVMNVIDYQRWLQYVILNILYTYLYVASYFHALVMIIIVKGTLYGKLYTRILYDFMACEIILYTYTKQKGKNIATCHEVTCW